MSLDVKICPLTEKPCQHASTCDGRYAIRCWLRTASEPDYGHKDSQG